MSKNENIEKTKEAVIDQLEEIKNGNFTNEDINFAEMAIKNDFKSVADSAGNVSHWYFDCIRKNDIVTPEEKARTLPRRIKGTHNRRRKIYGT